MKQDMYYVPEDTRERRDIPLISFRRPEDISDTYFLEELRKTFHLYLFPEPTKYTDKDGYLCAKIVDIRAHNDRQGFVVTVETPEQEKVNLEAIVSRMKSTNFLELPKVDYICPLSDNSRITN